MAAGGLPVDNTVGVGALAPMQIPGSFTFLTLPSIPNLQNGVLCFTSDAGMCVWDGSGAWKSAAIAGTWTPAGTSAAAINAAYTAASANGGGTVYLAGKRYPLEISIIPKSGVKLKGVQPQPVYSTIPDSGSTTLAGSAGGTVLAPTGAFDAIAWNTASLAAPASQTAFSQLALTNIAFEDLGFDGSAGGIWAIHAGGTNNASCWYSQFTRLYVTGFTNTAGGGFNITNYQHCQFNGNYTFGCAWGQLHQIDVASASLAPGNSTYYDLYCCNPIGSGTNAITARNISFLTTATTGGAANNNQFKFDRLQSNRFGSATTTQAATMTNAQATFNITDSTKFPVGMPVVFSAAVNGFAINQIYFVVTSAANVISVSLTYGGAAVNATGSTAVNVINQGFPCFEMISLAGSGNTNAVMDDTDCEGGGTCAMLFQNMTSLILHATQWPGGAQSTQSICGRSLVNAVIFTPADASTDFDGNASSRNIQFYGRRATNPSVQYMGAGLWYDNASGKTVFSMGYQNDGQAAGLLTWDPATSGGLCTPKNAGIGHFSKNVNSLSFAVSSLNCVLSNGTLNAVNTLPTAGAANFGSWLRVINHTANAQTINTDGTQLFNSVAGRTSITLNASAVVELEAVQSTTGPAYTWDIIGGTSACVAGVISAPS